MMIFHKVDRHCFCSFLSVSCLPRSPRTICRGIVTPVDKLAKLEIAISGHHYALQDLLRAPGRGAKRLKGNYPVMAFLKPMSATGIRLKASAALAGLVSVLMLAACGGSLGSSSVAENNEAPIALAPKGGAAQTDAATLKGDINEAELRKAVDRYRIIKQRGESAYDFAAADLNGDGRIEAIVLFTGKDWCQKTGCSLVIFQQEQTGFRPVSHVTSVRPPVLIGPESNYGWRDLVVKSGGGNAPVRDVRLTFSGKGYAGNALLQPEAQRDIVAQSQQILAESPAFSAAVN